MGSTEEFAKVLQRKQASFLSISDLMVEYFGDQTDQEEYPSKVIQNQQAFLRIRKEKKYRLRKADFKIYRQAVMDYTSTGHSCDSPSRTLSQRHLAARDKHQLILSMTPAGTDEELSNRSLSSTPSCCASSHTSGPSSSALRSNRSRSHSTINRKTSGAISSETLKGFPKSPDSTASTLSLPTHHSSLRRHTKSSLRAQEQFGETKEAHQSTANHLVIMPCATPPGSPRSQYESFQNTLVPNDASSSESSPRGMNFITECISTAKKSPLLHHQQLISTEVFPGPSHSHLSTNNPTHTTNGMWPPANLCKHGAEQCLGTCSSSSGFFEDSSHTVHPTDTTEYSSEDDSFYLNAKPKLSERINALFGKIGGSAFELLDDHKSSLGECVANEYMLASLFEHKTGSMFFYGVVDTIFWHAQSHTLSLVQFQTTSKTTPSPHHVMQLHCFREIAVKKKLSKRIKLYVLGLHLEADGPRLKLWRYKPTSCMPSIKNLLFDPKNSTREKLLNCPEFSFLLRNHGVMYEVV